jgi:uncharacterized PurR-regulated membrane protein YhhQ (DUF165 family)
LLRRIIAWVLLILFIVLSVNLFTLRLYPTFSIVVYVGVFVYYIVSLGRREH